MAVAFHVQGVVANWGANTATQTTASFTTSANDLIVVALSAEQNSGTTTFGNPVTTGITYGSPKVSAPLTTAHGQTIIWAATDSSGGARTAAVTASVADEFGIAAVAFTGASGIGATANGNFAGSTQTTLSLTTTAANSGILWVMADWQAGNYPSRLYQNINGFTPVGGGTGEVAYSNIASQYTAWCAYWPNVGAAGAKTVGASTNITGAHSMAAVEILASASGPPQLAPPPKLYVPQFVTADRAARW